MEAAGLKGDPIDQLRRFADESSLDRRLAPLRAAEAATYLAVIVTAATPMRFAAVVATVLTAVAATLIRGLPTAVTPIQIILTAAKVATVIAVLYGTDAVARAGATWGLVSSLVVLAFAALSKVAVILIARHDARES